MFVRIGIYTEFYLEICVWGRGGGQHLQRHAPQVVGEGGLRVCTYVHTSKKKTYVLYDGVSDHM